MTPTRGDEVPSVAEQIDLLLKYCEKGWDRMGREMRQTDNVLRVVEDARRSAKKALAAFANNDFAGLVMHATELQSCEDEFAIHLFTPALNNQRLLLRMVGDFVTTGVKVRRGTVRGNQAKSAARAARKPKLQCAITSWAAAYSAKLSAKQIAALILKDHGAELRKLGCNRTTVDSIRKLIPARK